MIPKYIFNAIQFLLICMGFYYLLRAINFFLTITHNVTLWNEIRRLRISIDHYTAMLKQILEEKKNNGKTS